eukprot:CAMPEP_0181308346 /NCGR_PEP_ID=MMETSP1101-20121128/11412_1 /TAXON_ID=46948 /ORGANISM="Rhodomonas abbreviata, Strain Caron Lab Isolate" /LENGTH=174 /DNA_ID=CAMNT_0023414719 /DNA_START=143 /DNA_END=664 /DNA_ORIENTATION=-
MADHQPTEQLYDFAQGDEHCEYADQFEGDPEAPCFEQEEAMFAHIPGMQGRAAGLGDQFSNIVFGKQFGIDNTAPDASAETTPPPSANVIYDETHDEQFETGFLSTYPPSNTCCNPFAGTNRTPKRWTHVPDAIWKATTVFLGCLHVLISIFPMLSIPRTRATAFTTLLFALIL